MHIAPQPTAYHHPPHLKNFDVVPFSNGWMGRKYLPKSRTWQSVQGAHMLHKGRIGIFLAALCCTLKVQEILVLTAQAGAKIVLLSTEKNHNNQKKKKKKAGSRMWAVPSTFKRIQHVTASFLTKPAS